MTTDNRDMDGIRILVVEDDTNNRIVIVRLLVLAGIPRGNIFDFDGDPLERLPHDTTRFDLAFLDLQMPGKDGFAVISDIRKDDRFAKARIIALSANVLRNDVERSKAAGFDGFVGKPIDGRKFSELFSRILSGEAVWKIQ